MDSDEARFEAVKAVRFVTGCSDSEAGWMISSMAAYFSRFNEEIVNRHGPAHEYCEANGI